MPRREKIAFVDALLNGGSPVTRGNLRSQVSEKLIPVHRTVTGSIGGILLDSLAQKKNGAPPGNVPDELSIPGNQQYSNV